MPIRSRANQNWMELNHTREAIHKLAWSWYEKIKQRKYEYKRLTECILAVLRQHHSLGSINTLVWLNISCAACPPTYMMSVKPVFPRLENGSSCIRLGFIEGSDLIVVNFIVEWLWCIGVGRGEVVVTMRVAMTMSMIVTVAIAITVAMRMRVSCFVLSTAVHYKR